MDQKSMELLRHSMTTPISPQHWSEYPHQHPRLCSAPTRDGSQPRTIVLRQKTSPGLGSTGKPLPQGWESTQDNSQKSENLPQIGALPSPWAQVTYLHVVVPVKAMTHTKCPEKKHFKKRRTASLKCNFLWTLGMVFIIVWIMYHGH